METAIAVIKDNGLIVGLRVIDISSLAVRDIGIQGIKEEHGAGTVIDSYAMTYITGAWRYPVISTSGKIIERGKYETFLKDCINYYKLCDYTGKTRRVYVTELKDMVDSGHVTNLIYLYRNGISSSSENMCVTRIETYGSDFIKDYDGYIGRIEKWKSKLKLTGSTVCSTSNKGVVDIDGEEENGIYRYDFPDTGRVIGKMIPVDCSKHVILPESIQSMNEYGSHAIFGSTYGLKLEACGLLACEISDSYSGSTNRIRQSMVEIILREKTPWHYNLHLIYNYINSMQQMSSITEWVIGGIKEGLSSLRDGSIDSAEYCGVTVLRKDDTTDWKEEASKELLLYGYSIIGRISTKSAAAVLAKSGLTVQVEKEIKQIKEKTNAVRDLLNDTDNRSCHQPGCMVEGVMIKGIHSSNKHRSTAVIDILLVNGMVYCKAGGSSSSYVKAGRYFEMFSRGQ